MNLKTLALTCALTQALSVAQAPGPAPRRQLLLLTAGFNDPNKNLATFTLAWMAREKGMEYEAYYATDRGDGGIFSAHGSSMIGGRHETAIAHALARFETTVVRLGDIVVFESLIRTGARSVIQLDSGLAALYANFHGGTLPPLAVAIQTKNLPKGVEYIQPYLFPDVVQRKAAAFPLEMTASEVANLRRLGVKEVLTIASDSAPVAVWKQAGITVMPLETLRHDDTLFGVTSRIAKRHIDRAAGVDLCEPDLAAHWVPFSIREHRVQICSTPTTQAAVDAIPELLKGKASWNVYGRYGGGSVRGVGDIGLWPMFRANISFQVVEPGRPVLTILSTSPAPISQPAKSWLDMEPSDEQLREWAKQGRVLAGWLLHSGEMSHDDAIPAFIEFAGVRKIPIGMGVHWQRYAFEPWSVESAYVPREQGGALGFIEPVLHSAGNGIIAEGAGEPSAVAKVMSESRARIARLAGENAAPRGVFCYQDADMSNYNEPATPLWKAIRAQGFEYVVSNVANGQNKVLYRDGDFVVINMIGSRFRSSPFVKHLDGEMETAERAQASTGKPGWLLAVLDLPVYTYSPYTSVGHKWGAFKRVHDFFDFLEKGAKERNLIPATPRTIARYARILMDSGILPVR